MLDIGAIWQYNVGSMFTCSIEPVVVGIIIAVVVVQYAFALFCLLKLAYLDITKKEYVLWNLFILLVFFIGDIAFLIYYSKVKDKKRIPPYVPPAEQQPQADAQAEADAAEREPLPQADDSASTDGTTDSE